MRRILILLITLLMVFCTASAQVEMCRHAGLMAEIPAISFKDVDGGHVQEFTRTGVCPDCGNQATRVDEGGLTGHVFYMSESIHFTEDEMHLWVFICLDCMHVTVVEEPCAGGDQCLIYSAQAGVRPPVQYGESLEAWHQDTTTEDYVKRWVAQQNKE